MNNEIEITTDGVNIYATLSVKSNKIGVVILAVMLISVFGLILSIIPSDEMGEVLIPMLVFAGLMIAFPLRYMFWNIYGKEYLIINTKTISYQYDYGFFQTNLKTNSFRKLGTGFELMRKEEEIEIGKLIFYNYNQENNLPEMIHQTSVLIDRETINELDLEIRNLFIEEYLEENRFRGFSLN